MDPETAHDFVRRLALVAAPEAAREAMLYASARTPGHTGTFATEPSPHGLDKLKVQHVSCFECRELVVPSRGGLPCLHELFTPITGRFDPRRSPESPLFVLPVTPELAGEVLAGCYLTREGRQLYVPREGWRWIQ